MILAIDPGKDKNGIAVMDEEEKIYFKGIVFSKELDSFIIDLLNRFNIEVFVLGDGTFSNELADRLSCFLLPVFFIEEAYTTLEAEERYRKEHYRGWKKLFKYIKWKPSCPVDDYVAVILAERYLKEKSQRSGKKY